MMQLINPQFRLSRVGLFDLWKRTVGLIAHAKGFMVFGVFETELNYNNEKSAPNQIKNHQNKWIKSNHARGAAEPNRWEP